MSSREGNNQPQLPALPNHLIVDQILTRLPVKSLLRFKAVCKSWRLTISFRKFAKSHLKLSSTLTRHHHFMLARRAEGLHSTYGGEVQTPIKRKYRDFIENTETRLWSCGFIRIVHDPYLCVENTERLFPGYDHQKNQIFLLAYDVCINNFKYLAGRSSPIPSYDVSDKKFKDLYNLQLDSEYIEYHPPNVRLVGTCNGLVCLSFHSSDKRGFYIWNPATRQCREISVARNKFGDGGPCAFVDDYKIVGFSLAASRKASSIKFYSFSCKTSKWKTIPSCLTKFGDELLTILRPVLVDHTLHWVIYNYGTFDHFNPKWFIVSFDIATQKFEENPWHITNLLPDFRFALLFKSKGCLSLYLNGVDGNGFIWVMNNHGDWNSWKKLDFADAEPCLCTPKTESCEPAKYLVQNSTYLRTRSNKFKLKLNPGSEEDNQSGIDINLEAIGLDEDNYVESLVSPFRKQSKRKKMQ